MVNWTGPHMAPATHWGEVDEDQAEEMVGAIVGMVEDALPVLLPPVNIMLTIMLNQEERIRALEAAVKLTATEESNE